MRTPTYTRDDVPGTLLLAGMDPTDRRGPIVQRRQEAKDLRTFYGRTDTKNGVRIGAPIGNVDDAPDLDGADPHAGPAETAELRDLVRHVLARLTGRMRRALAGRMRGEDVETIARRMQCAQGTVRALVHQARARLGDLAPY